MNTLDSNFWKKYFKIYDYLNTFFPYRELLSDTLKNLDLNSNDTILDAGAGTGNLSVLINHKVNKIIAIDSSQEGLEMINRKCPEIITMKCNLENRLPFQDKEFNKIVCCNTLYLINQEKVQNLVNEFFRILKNGGKLVIVNPIKESKPIKIYIAHLKKSFQVFGYIKTLFNSLLGLFKIIELYYNNIKILLNNKFNKPVGFLTKGQLEKILKDAQFRYESSILTYANQAVIITGIK